MSSWTIEASDPLIDVEDKFPLLPAAGSSILAVPFGFRFATHPIRAGKHGKTYTTVEDTEDTERSDDGKVYTIPDTVRREEETD